jgi:transcription elongation factor SPT6
MIHEDGLEIPTIWLYKRDYLPQTMSRSELWEIFWLDVKYRTLEKEKLSALSTIQNLEDSFLNVVGHSERSETEDILHLRQCIEYPSNDDTLNFAIAALSLLVQRLNASSDSLNNVKNRTTYGKYSHQKEVRAVMRALVSPAHIVGKALKNEVELSPPRIPSLTFQEFVASVLTSDNHIPTDAEISQLSSISFNVAAKEIAWDPLVRHLAKKFYLEVGSLNTNVTERGVTEISPFSEYFGLHMLRRKPLKEFLSADGLSQFMRLIEAEGKGIISIEFLNPFRDIQQLSQRQTSIAAFSDRIFGYLVKHASSESDMTASARSSFDEARLYLFEKLMGDNISPLAIKDAKAELLKLGRAYIMTQACDCFERKLQIGPFYGGFAGISKNLQIARLLLECPNRPRCQKVVGMFISPDSGSIDAVCIDKEGSVLSTCFMPTLMTTDWEEKLKLFLFEHRPDTIVLNSSGRDKTSRVRVRIETKIIGDVNEVIRVSSQVQDSDEEEEKESQVNSFSAQVVILDDEIPCIFMRSQRAKDLYPELDSKACAALSLARLSMEPLLEYCSLWKGVDSMSNFGFEAMYLKLHPLQDMIKSDKKYFLHMLEMKLVQAVSDIGVDLHQAIRYQHYGIMLAFVPGLGLRKAEKLIRNVNRFPDRVASRFSLHDDERFLTSSIWTNTSGFIKLSQKFGYQRFNPLDNTRIHPICYEVYDFVRRICADALNVDNKPESQMQIIADVKSNIRKTIEKVFLPDKSTQLIKWERVLEGVEFGSSIIADGGFSTKYKEIKDFLEELELSEYAEELEANGKGRRKMELSLIKDELRYPWLDLRKYNYGYSQEEYRNFVKRDNFSSIHLGQKLGLRVIEIRDSKTPFVLIETDDGIRGFVSESELSDDQNSFSYRDLCTKISVGERRLGVVIGLRYGDNLVMSLRPSMCNKSEAWWMRKRTDTTMEAREWWSMYCLKRGLATDLRSIFDKHFTEEEALMKFEKTEKAAISSVAEQIATTANVKIGNSRLSSSEKIDQSVRFHPFFVNLSANESENYLRRRGTENRISIPAVIRPSSRGPTHLALVWAFRPDQFMHIHIEQVPNQREPGRVMFIVDHPSSNRSFVDIDEIFSEYIGRMHDYVLAMTKHKNFHPGSAADVEQDMRRQVTENPDRITYYLRYDGSQPGMFAITWMDKTFACRTMKVMVTNTGFQSGSRSFSSPNDIVAWLKRSASQSEQAKSGTAPPRRQSRFA